MKLNIRDMLVRKIIAFFVLTCTISCDLLPDSNPLHTPKIFTGEYLKLATAMKAEDLNRIESIVKENHLNLNYADSLHHL